MLSIPERWLSGTREGWEAGEQETVQGIGEGAQLVLRIWGVCQTGTAGNEESWEIRQTSADRTGQNQCREVGRWVGGFLGSPELFVWDASGFRGTQTRVF